VRQLCWPLAVSILLPAWIGVHAPQSPHHQLRSEIGARDGYLGRPKGPFQRSQQAHLARDYRSLRADYGEGQELAIVPAPTARSRPAAVTMTCPSPTQRG